MSYKFDDDDNTSLYIDDPIDENPIDIDAILIFFGLSSPSELDTEKAKRLAELYGVSIEDCKHPTVGLFEKMYRKLKEMNNIDIEDEKGTVIK